LYEQAFDRGLKGCTTFRPNPVTGSILKAMPPETQQAKHHCCDIDREMD
jgi:ribonucleoside-diphosphate reductase alpha chain